MADLTIPTLETKACEYAAHLVENFELISLIQRKNTKIMAMEANLSVVDPDYSQRKAEIARRRAKLELLEEAEGTSKDKCKVARAIFRSDTKNLKFTRSIGRAVSALAIGTVCSTTKDIHFKDQKFLISKRVGVEFLAPMRRILDTLKVKYEAPTVGFEPQVPPLDSDSDSESDPDPDPPTGGASGSGGGPTPIATGTLGGPNPTLGISGPMSFPTLGPTFNPGPFASVGLLADPPADPPADTPHDTPLFHTDDILGNLSPPTGLLADPSAAAVDTLPGSPLFDIDDMLGNSSPPTGLLGDLPAVDSPTGTPPLDMDHIMRNLPGPHF